MKSQMTAKLLFGLGTSVVFLTTFTAFAAEKAVKAEKKAGKKAIEKAEKTPTNEVVLAEVNGVRVTQSQLDQRIQTLPVQLQASFQSQKGLLLEDMVNQELLFQEAKKRKLENDAKVQKAFDTLKQGILVQRMLELEVLEKVKVPTEEVRKYFDEHKADFKVPESIHPFHILVADEGKAKDVAQRLGKGEDFSAVAKEVSVCPSAPRGGDLGMVRKGQMVPEFEEAAFQLKVGEISPVVKTQFGYHVIKISEKTPAQERAFEEISGEIENMILETKRREALQGYLKVLKDQGQVKLYPERVK